MIRGASSGLPASGIARISNFALCAGTHSAPNVASVGPAVLTPKLPPQGHPILKARRTADVRSGAFAAGRPRLYGSGYPADVHPGLVSIPGSQSVLEPPCVVSSAGQPCGCALSPKFGRSRISILPLTNRLQPASDPVREGAKSDPGVGLLHLSKMEQANAERVASAYVKPRE